MQSEDLKYSNLQDVVLKPYRNRAATSSGQFLVWFLENIFRLDEQDADDANVDSKFDKGIDGIYVNEQLETVFLIQSKVRQKDNVELGDVELKEFWGSVEQFRSTEQVNAILSADNVSADIKNSINRNSLIDRINSGYSVVGVFATNIPANKDATSYTDNVSDFILYDSKRIAEEFIDAGTAGGIQKTYAFDVSDSDVIPYRAKKDVEARIFLAKGTDLISLDGIADGKLFEQNVRLSLGNTKINKALNKSISDPHEHAFFPLYHNGITLICDSFDDTVEGKLSVKNYMVVNGAQSISTMHKSAENVTDDLKVLLKIVSLKSDLDLAQKITHNSNNQNAIKARDMRSNNKIQTRLKTEFDRITKGALRYEIKRGENHQGNDFISNENAGLILLGLDLGNPWSCHQKYRVMDDLHAQIFGRVDVDAYKIYVLNHAFEAVKGGLANIENAPFANYNLTKYFLGYAVMEILKSDEVGKEAYRSYRNIFEKDQVTDYCSVIGEIADTTAYDINANVQELIENSDFDYKANLKSPRWCRQQAKDLVASYLKDVRRKKADPIAELMAPFVA